MLYVLNHRPWLERRLKERQKLHRDNNRLRYINWGLTVASTVKGQNCVGCYPEKHRKSNSSQVVPSVLLQARRERVAGVEGAADADLGSDGFVSAGVTRAMKNRI